MAELRRFETGATRDIDSNKHDYEGFISPLVIREFGRYMHEHRFQKDGSVRESDNWQKGIPQDQYVKSLMRHFMDVWTLHRGYKTIDFDGNEVNMKDALNGIIFNASGILHTILLKEQNEEKS